VLIAVYVRKHFNLGCWEMLEQWRLRDWISTNCKLHWEMSISLWESVVECYSLYLKCLPKVHVLKAWFLCIVCSEMAKTVHI
jgi:hypothetical protein